MGGYGSTRWRLHIPKTTVEDCLNISVSDFYRRFWNAGVLRKGGEQVGNLTWSRGGTQIGSISWRLDVHNADRRLTFDYRKNGVPVNLVISIVSTPVFDGGVRWWFSCPLCRRRCGTLHLTSGSLNFGCRKCHQLTYTSAQEAHKFDALMASIGAPKNFDSP